MKKVLIVCLFPFYLLASQEFFVSTGLGLSSFNVSYIAIDHTNGKIKETNHFGRELDIHISGGVILDDSHKFGVEYTNYFSKENNLVSSYSFSYDYRIIDLYRYDSILSYNFIPFVGLSYNYMQYERTASKVSGMNTGKLSYSLQLKSLMGRAGFDYEFDNSPIYFTAQYEYSIMANADRYLYTTTNNNVDYTVYVQHNTLSRLLFSVGYRF